MSRVSGLLMQPIEEPIEDPFYPADSWRDPGCYVLLGPPGSDLPSEASRVPCPYCQAPLSRQREPYGRIKAILDDGATLVDPIPAGLAFLACMDCRQVFIAPEEQL